MNNLVYKKRAGTSGASGQLYETKLLSLILFRVLNDEDIEEFFIGTNVDGLGEFDDICLRFKLKEFDKPVAVFLQAKHRDDMNKCLAVNSIDLPKYFDSYLKIRNKFNVNSSDAIFKGTYEDVECAFVFYTNTRDELDKEYHESNYISKINDVISTGDDAFQLPYTEKDVKLLNQMVLHSIIEQLAILIADTVRVKGNNYKSLMNNELMQTYHVILSHRVFIDSDVQKDDNTDYRMARFNHTFFDTTDDHLKLLGEGLVNEALKDKKLSSKETLDSSALPSSEPSFVDINETFDNDDAHLREGLNAIESSDAESQRRSACVKEYCSKSFKLPATFGNRDLTLSGESSRKEKRLCYLANKLIHILKESNVNNVNDDTFNIVPVDDKFPDKGFLRLNGGIAGAVGNLLIFDEETRLLMFQDGNNLAGHARTLFDKINSEVKELKQYRFDVRVKNFPKLSFDCNEDDKTKVLDFTNRLLFCTNQARESEVERILKEDIGRLQTTRERCNFQIKSDAIFLAYHDNIQKLWLQQKNPKYLTKTSHVFQNSIDRFIKNPLLSIANVLSKNKIMKNDIKFDREVVKLLKLDASFSKITIIVSEVIALSIVKVTQSIKNDDYYLIDLNYVISLPLSDCNRLHEELKNVKNNVLILTYKLSQVTKLNKDIKAILQLLKQKKLIVVTNYGSVSDIRKFFVQADFFIIDDKSSLVDLTKESQETINKNCNVIFQGVHVNLNVLVDDEATEFIKGDLMDKIMSGEVMRVGQPITTSRYEEIKDFYVSRRVISKHIGTVHQLKTNLNAFFDMDDDDSDIDNDAYDVEIKLETFYDIRDHDVLITAEPGMGKSFLLTHLSLSTKARDPGVWIVRINLLDYSRFFHQWTENKAVIDILEVLKFICIASINLNANETLILDYNKNGEIYLKYFCTDTDKETIFQINLLLQYWNRRGRKVIFAFDGFDEICPHYESQVIQLLNILKRFRRPKEHRIWVTSRTYSKILQSLESVFNVSRKLEPFDFKDQQKFTQKYLKLKLDLKKLDQKQMKKIDDFIAFMERSHRVREDEVFGMLYKCHSLPLHTVYLEVVQYFKDEIKHVLFLQDKDKYVKVWDLNVYEMKTGRQLYDGEMYDDVNHMKEFIATPLHINMVVDYFQHQIKHVETDTIWDLNLNTYAIYEYIVETKFRKIRFEEKNQMDLYKPDVQLAFDRERKNFINEHKKLAAYAMFYKDAHQLFSETELDEIKKIISTIDSGQEKTGVIYTVINGVARFMHLTFAEYFAVEYICDRLKTEQSDDELKSLWEFIFNTLFYKYNLGVLNVLDDKLITDDGLMNKVSDARFRRVLFDVLITPWAGEGENSELHIMLSQLIYEKLNNFTSLFLSTLEFITPDNVQWLVRFIVESNIILAAVTMENTKFINVVLDTVRIADPSQIYMLFCELPDWSERCDSNTPNEVIVDMVKRYKKRK